MHFRASGYLLLAWGLTACSIAEKYGGGRSVGPRRVASPRGTRGESCTPGSVCLVFSRQEECPNWDAALALAKKKSGCAGSEGDGPQALKCRKGLACDICQFLDDGRWPPAYIRDSPGGKTRLLGHVEGATEIRDRYSPGSINAAWVEFRKARCYGAGVGIWPFWEDNVEYLAKAMMHESLHLYKIVGATAPLRSIPRPRTSLTSVFRDERDARKATISGSGDRHPRCSEYGVGCARAVLRLVWRL